MYCIIVFSALLLVVSTNLVPNAVVLPSIIETSIDTNPVKESSVLSKSLNILSGGVKSTIIDDKKLTELITAKIVSPVVILNSKIAAAAGALPSLFAAKGALIGAAIATPIEVGAVAASSITSGVTGKLVAIPVSIISTTAGKVKAAIKIGNKIWTLKTLAIKNGAKIAARGAITLGHILLKPIAVIAGAKTAATGIGLGVAGSGVKALGTGIEVVGTKIAATGLKTKGVGALVIGFPFIKKDVGVAKTIVG